MYRAVALAALRQGLGPDDVAAVTQLTALTLGVQIAAKRLEKTDLFAGRQTTSSSPDLLTATASSSEARYFIEWITAAPAGASRAVAECTEK